MEKGLYLLFGLLIGATTMFLAAKNDLKTCDRTIAKLEKKANLVPVVTVDALGICKVTQGGKAYLLIDVTEETKPLDVIEQNIINQEEK